MGWRKKTKLIIRRTLTGETSGQYSVPVKWKETTIATYMPVEKPMRAVYPIETRIRTERVFRYSGRKTRGGIEIWLEVAGMEKQEGIAC